MRLPPGLAKTAMDAYRLAERVRGWIFARLCGAAFQGFGARSVIRQPARIFGERFIRLGSDVYIGEGSWLHVHGNAFAPGTAVIDVGDGVSISGHCTLAAARSITLERKVLIGRFVHISDHRHAYQDTSLPVKDQGLAGIAPVLIQEGAWLGQGVVVCPGVTIGKGAVIGAYSVVRADVPAFCVAAGSPAKIIRDFSKQPVQP